MNARAILMATDASVQAEIRSMFQGGRQIMAWAVDPNEWEIYEAGYVDSDGITFDMILEGYEDETPIAVALLKPDELANGIEYPIYDRDGVDVIGEYNGD